MASRKGSAPRVPSSAGANGEDAASGVRPETSPPGDPATASAGSPLLPVPRQIDTELRRGYALGRHAKKLSKKALRQAAGTELANYANRLDPSTYETWIMIARLRSGNLQLDDVVRISGIDEDLLNRIVSSPNYMGFEAIYRKVHLATPELDAAARMLIDAQIEANETILYWMRQRAIPVAHLSLAAAKLITSFNEPAMGQKKRRIGVRVDLTSDQQKRFEVAIEE